MRRRTRRYGLQSLIFTPNPWAVMGAAVQKATPAAIRPAATAFLVQAEEYYRAATVSGLASAKPVLLYYCFMNMVKSLVLTVQPRVNFGQPKHGLSEKMGPGGKEFSDAYLDAYRSGASVNIFDSFLEALTGQPLAAATVRLDIPAVAPQIVTGHRLWSQATGGRERFIAIESIHFMHDRTQQQVWLRFCIPSGDLTRLGLGHQTLLHESGLSDDWHEVTSGFSGVLCFEQKVPTRYTHRPSDVLPEVASQFRKALWTTVLSLPPYRKYYLYTAPVIERPQVLPQLASIYAIMYYLGSITRYRPQDFSRILAGDYGAQIHTILSEQPTQFIYLMTSEFAKQEVTKAAVV
jgi:hypothetical protein